VQEALDAYALGVVLWELLLGKPWAVGMSATEVLLHACPRACAGTEGGIEARHACR
jgi:hypothetical protein